MVLDDRLNQHVARSARRLCDPGVFITVLADLSRRSGYFENIPEPLRPY